MELWLIFLWFSYGLKVKERFFEKMEVKPRVLLETSIFGRPRAFV